MQTKFGSFVESWANIAIGFTINYVANLLILPAFGFASLTPGKNFMIGVIYTGISLVRSYVLRRTFTNIKAAWNVGTDRLPPKNEAKKPQSRFVPTLSKYGP